MQPLDPPSVVSDRTYQRLIEAIADGTLAPGQRMRQEGLGRALGVSLQPISHALQLLKQQELVEENGRRGLIVSEIGTVTAQWPHLKTLDRGCARRIPKSGRWYGPSIRKSSASSWPGMPGAPSAQPEATPAPILRAG
jgi:DNA-binding transcriptional MocR family regulator